jgi:hypothetical protein
MDVRHLVEAIGLAERADDTLNSNPKGFAQTRCYFTAGLIRYTVRRRRVAQSLEKILSQIQQPLGMYRRDGQCQADGQHRNDRFQTHELSETRKAIIRTPTISKLKNGPHLLDLSDTAHDHR